MFVSFKVEFCPATAHVMMNSGVAKFAGNFLICYRHYLYSYKNDSASLG